MTYSNSILNHLWSKSAISRAERTPQSRLPSSIVNRFKIQSMGGPASTKGRGLSADSNTSDTRKMKKRRKLICRKESKVIQ